MSLSGGGLRPVTYLFIDAAHVRANFARATAEWCGTSGKLLYRNMNGHFNAQKVFVYDSIDDSVHVGEDSETHRHRVAQQETLFRSISALPNTHVRLGSISGAGKKRRQKEVDILIAVEMLNHAVRQNMDRAILLTGDRDFTPLVDALLQFGVTIDVAGDVRATSDILAAAADNFRPLGIQWYLAIADDATRNLAPPRFSFTAGEGNRSGTIAVAEGLTRSHRAELFARPADNTALLVMTNEHGSMHVIFSPADVERMKLFLDLEYGGGTWMPDSITSLAS